MKVRVDHNRCIGSGRCEIIAPKTFRLNEDGQAEAAEQPGDAPEAIRWAAFECPVDAIIVEEEEDGAPAPVDKGRSRS